MKQHTLAMAADQEAGFAQHGKPTRRDTFLQPMESIVPWAALCAVIEPYYHKAGDGRPPIGLEHMLRIHFLQDWLNLADLSCEEALYDSASLRRFVCIDLGREAVPDATLISAPSSTKNANKVRDPEMHKTRKGQQWYFGMNLHIGVNSQSGLVHSAVVNRPWIISPASSQTL